jgi:hypothetical protein
LSSGEITWNGRTLTGGEKPPTSGRVEEDMHKTHQVRIALRHSLEVPLQLYHAPCARGVFAT